MASVTIRLSEVSVTSALSSVDLWLPEGSGSHLVSGPVLSDVGVRSGNLPLRMVPSVLKGLLNWCRVITLSNSPMKVGRGVCRGRGVVMEVGSGVETSNGVGKSRIRSTGGSSGPVYTTSIQAGC